MVAEWLYAIREGTASSPAAGSIAPQGPEEPTAGMTQMMPQMAGEEAAPTKSDRKPIPVMLLKANSLGIRGLNSGLGEWGLRITEKGSGNKQSRLEYIVLGAFGRSPGTPAKSPSLVARHPWEAFEEVGFRTVIGMGKSNH